MGKLVRHQLAAAACHGNQDTILIWPDRDLQQFSVAIFHSIFNYVVQNLGAAAGVPFQQAVAVFPYYKLLPDQGQLFFAVLTFFAISFA